MTIAPKGYEDNVEEDEEDEDDGSYADDEYGKKKAPKKRKKKSQPSSSAPRPKGVYPVSTVELALSFCTAISRNNDSDSDSDYGSRSKKKKRPRVSGDEIRVSSRGGKIPNYTDDVQALAELSEEDVDQGYYVDPTAQFKEEDEIESVLSHCRDEGREDDPEDIWFDNVVSPRIILGKQIVVDMSQSVFTSSGKISRICITLMRPTNFSNASRASSVLTTISKLTRYTSLASMHQASLRKMLRHCFLKKNAKRRSSRPIRSSNALSRTAMVQRA